MTVHLHPSRVAIQNRQILRPKAPKRNWGKGLDSIAIAREESRRVSTREHDRQPLDGQLVEASFRGRLTEATLLNVSGGGAMIAARLRPNVAERIDLLLGDAGAIECRVRWLKNSRIGLEFAHETQLRCTNEERRELLRRVLESLPSAGEEQRQDRAPKHGNLSLEESQDRALARHPLVWLGQLTCGSYKWDVRLRNISESGALVECQGAVQIGTQVLLDLSKAVSISAQVCWAAGDHIGLKFFEPFDIQSLAHANPSIAATWVMPDYLQPKDGDETGSNEAWLRMSIDELRQELEGFLKR